MSRSKVHSCGFPFENTISCFSDYNGEPIGPLRVWLKYDDIPGLAMTRSLGDGLAQKVGVTPEPEVMEFRLSKDYKFLVIASDGVWEFLSNMEVRFESKISCFAA